MKHVRAWNAVLIVGVSMPRFEFGTVAVTASRRFTRVLVGSEWC